MLTLPTLLLQASERPHGGEWVWLWDLELQRRTKSLPPVVFRMTSHAAQVAWPPSGGDVFYPFPFSMSDLEQTNEGDLPTMDLSVDNTGRVLMELLHDGEGFEGNRATLYLTHEDALTTSPAQQLEVPFEIATAIASDDAVGFRLEMNNLNESRTPSARYIQGTCRWKFGGIECGYPITPTAGFTTCPKTVDACTLRGDDEVARGLPRLHPRRIGCFPGIATQRSN